MISSWMVLLGYFLKTPLELGGYYCFYLFAVADATEFNHLFPKHALEIKGIHKLCITTNGAPLKTVGCRCWRKTTLFHLETTNAGVSFEPFSLYKLMSRTFRSLSCEPFSCRPVFGGYRLNTVILQWYKNVTVQMMAVEAISLSV